MALAISAFGCQLGKHTCVSRSDRKALPRSQEKRKPIFAVGADIRSRKGCGVPIIEEAVSNKSFSSSKIWLIAASNTSAAFLSTGGMLYPETCRTCMLDRPVEPQQKCTEKVRVLILSKFSFVLCPLSRNVEVPDRHQVCRQKRRPLAPATDSRPPNSRIPWRL